jgi:hypothetical protein
MKDMVKLFGIIVFMAVIGFPVMAGGSKDKSTSAAPAATAPRDVKSFEGTWVSADYQETYESPAGSGNEVKEDSTFTFWANDDGEPMVESNYIHWHFAPMYEVRGDTLAITIEGDNGREDYRVFKITGDALVWSPGGNQPNFTYKRKE